jgi:hypothetical protein
MMTMGNLDYLSRLVKENLPEGQVDSGKFTNKVIKALRAPDGIERLRVNIQIAEELSQIHRHVDPDRLCTRIHPDPYG